MSGRLVCCWGAGLRHQLQLRDGCDRALWGSRCHRLFAFGVQLPGACFVCLGTGRSGGAKRRGFAAAGQLPYAAPAAGPSRRSSRLPIQAPENATHRLHRLEIICPRVFCCTHCRRRRRRAARRERARAAAGFYEGPRLLDRARLCRAAEQRRQHLLVWDVGLATHVGVWCVAAG